MRVTRHDAICIDTMTIVCHHVENLRLLRRAFLHRYVLNYKLKYGCACRYVHQVSYGRNIARNSTK